MALTLGLQLANGVQPVNPVPTDSWSGPYEGATESLAKSAANTSIPSAARFKSMEVRLIIDGKSKKYWYANGISDSDLIEFNSFDVAIADSRYLRLTGGKLSGDLTIYGNLSATGNSYFANTIYSTTSALSVINVGNTGPAIYVGNNGTGDLASFYDLDTNLEVFHIGGANGSFPNVGVKTSFPNKDFTVNGEISASSNIWTSGKFLSGETDLLDILNPQRNDSVYTTVNSNSATTWNYQGTDLKGLSANWQNTYTSFSTVSSIMGASYKVKYIGNGVQLSFPLTGINTPSTNPNDYRIDINGVLQEPGDDFSLSSTNIVFSEAPSLSDKIVIISTRAFQPINDVSTNVGALSGNWQNTYTTVWTNSATWGTGGGAGVDAAVRALTGNWQTTYGTMSSLSGNWNSVYTVVQTNSAITWNYQGTDLKALSANWQSTYTTVNSNSATTWNNSLANFYADSRFLPLTGGSVTGSVSANGILYSNGNPTVTTVPTTTPGMSAATSIVVVSALPVTPIPGTLYIVL